MSEQGAAIVFWHECQATFPATLVRVVNLRDLQPKIVGSILTEKTICNANMNGRLYPCIIMYVNKSASAMELVEKYLANPEREMEFQEQGRRWSKELNGLKDAASIHEDPMASNMNSNVSESLERDISPEIALNPSQVREASERFDFRSRQTPAKFPSNFPMGLSPRPLGSTRSPSTSPEKSTCVGRNSVRPSSSSATPVHAVRKPAKTDSVLSTANNVHRNSQTPTLPRGFAHPKVSKGHYKHDFGPNLAFLEVPPLESWGIYKGVDIMALSRSLGNCGSMQWAFEVAMKALYKDREIINHVTSPTGAALTRKPILDQERWSIVVGLLREFSRDILRKPFYADRISNLLTALQKKLSK